MLTLMIIIFLPYLVNDYYLFVNSLKYIFNIVIGHPKPISSEISLIAFYNSVQNKYSYLKTKMLVSNFALRRTINLIEFLFKIF